MAACLSEKHPSIHLFIHLSSFGHSIVLFISLIFCQSAAAEDYSNFFI